LVLFNSIKMKRLINITFVLTLLLISSCSKSKDNYYCSIVAPQNEQEFYEDEDIQVSVETSDNGTHTVLLYIDNKCYTGSSDFPYNFKINAGDLLPGTHTVRVKAQNNDGKQSEASVNISVKSSNYESPDSVSFSDGKLPVGWQTNGWHISPVNPFDDQFFLFTKTDNASVTTLKTCSIIEFYIKGYGRVSFFVDNLLIDNISLAQGGPDGGGIDWKKYEYESPEGLHTFKWVYHSYPGDMPRAGLDAIRFR